MSSIESPPSSIVFQTDTTPAQPSLSVTETPALPQQVRLFRRGPAAESESSTVFARCIAEWLYPPAVDPVILGFPLKRLKHNSAKVLFSRLWQGVEVFVFDFGCVVVWGASRPQLARVVEAVSAWAQGGLEKPTEDKVAFSQQESSNVSCIAGDTILLATTSPLEKLAYSYALAQGVKLDVFEQALAECVEAVGDLPAEMAETGDARMTAKEASVRLGEIFLLQYEVNLRSDLLESPPDTFWDLDRVAPVYRLGRAYLDLDHRLRVLNKRLRFMRNMYTMVQSEAELKASHSMGWIITWGVAGEVLVAFLQMAVMLWFYLK